MVDVTKYSAAYLLGANDYELLAERMTFPIQIPLLLKSIYAMQPYNTYSQRVDIADCV